MIWVPSRDDDPSMSREAKRQAKKATRAGCTPQSLPYQARSTRLRLAVSQLHQQRKLPNNVGNYSKRIDRALPGKHTQALYDICKRREAGVLSQLRTGMAKINSYLNKIGAAESDMCECGCGPETMEHFLFRCTRWEAEREAMRRVGQNMVGNLSFFLGGKSALKLTDHASAAEDRMLNTWRWYWLAFKQLSVATGPMSAFPSGEIWGENARRAYAIIETAEFGDVLFVAIGATNVGSVVIHEQFQKSGVQVNKVDELGHFQFGGSSIIVAFQVERIKFDNDLLQLSKQRIQVSVEIGMSLGRATRSTRRGEMSPATTYAEVADPNA
ncbi:phosphatidylserine decarboxylase [Fusarium mundagurra]|uniref:Phosphatidylserine decarboxylase n=1 Tax=Fusarium mundagurra TaxID=1567541 RepID=A0A8H5XNL6_9HYPO|nr:phosphatidylserine decarboxylase [Fusarium mundagurra]